MSSYSYSRQEENGKDTLVFVSTQEQPTTKEESTATTNNNETNSQETTTTTLLPGEDQPSQPTGAYNPETGEINWDCPCLGGMANGPCGEQFKAAFSCFVYSENEQKGVECVDKFREMQDCFKEHPEIYSDHLSDEDDEEEEEEEEESVNGSEGEFSDAFREHVAETAQEPVTEVAEGASEIREKAREMEKEGVEAENEAMIPR